MIATIIHWATPPVSIDVSLKAFVFRCRDRLEVVEPVLWFATQLGGRRLVAIGADPVLTVPAGRVDIFASDWHRTPDRELVDLVGALCRYGMTKVMGRWSAGLPTVSIRWLHPMSEMERATIQEVLGRVLEMPNAWEVIWQETNGV